MSSVRPLEPLKLGGGVEIGKALGTRAELCLLPLDKLAVDERYQRAIGSKGKANVRRILQNFDWRKFPPLVVTRLEDGRYAIIDGQHRATAALMHPDVDMVPCMAIEVTPEEAAEVFAAINACITTMSPGQIFRARVAAGDKDAVAVHALCEGVGVKMLTYKPPRDYEVGETLACGAIERAYKEHGREVLVTALMAVVETADGNPGCLRAGLIRVLCEVLSQNRAWLDAGEALMRAFDQLEFYDLLERAGDRPGYQSYTPSQYLDLQIRRHLKKVFAHEAAA